MVNCLSFNVFKSCFLITSLVKFVQSCLAEWNEDFYVCMYMCIYLCVYVCVCVFMYVCLYVCVKACVLMNMDIKILWAKLFLPVPCILFECAHRSHCLTLPHTASHCLTLPHTALPLKISRQFAICSQKLLPYTHTCTHTHTHSVRIWHFCTCLPKDFLPYRKLEYPDSTRSYICTSAKTWAWSNSHSHSWSH